MLNISAESNFS